MHHVQAVANTAIGRYKSEKYNPKVKNLNPRKQEGLQDPISVAKSPRKAIQELDIDKESKSRLRVIWIRHSMEPIGESLEFLLGHASGVTTLNISGCYPIYYHH